MSSGDSLSYLQIRNWAQRGDDNYHSDDGDSGNIIHTEALNSYSSLKGKIVHLPLTDPPPEPRTQGQFLDRNLPH